MPYASNKGVKVHYQVEGSGPALLLAHGFAFSGEDWRELGYVDQLKDHYRVIMVDSRGHGESDKLYDPLAYEPVEQALDYLAVLDDLGIDRSGFWGFSHGGAIGYSMIKYAPERIAALIVGGLDPYPGSVDLGDRAPLIDKPWLDLPDADDPIHAALDGGGARWLHFFESNMDVPAGMKQRLLANDFRALIADWENPYQWRDFDHLIPQCAFPCLLYVGEAEWSYVGMKHCSTEMPRAVFVPLPNSNHFDIFAQPANIVPHVRNFLDALEAW